MKRPTYILIVGVTVFLLATVQFVRSRERAVKAAPVAMSIGRDRLIAAPGRVEAVSEEIRVSSELSGRLHSVPVEEGDRVRKGQVLAQIENEDYIARVAAAEAALAERQAELLRTVNGARSQERHAAEANLEAAKAVLENARREAERRRNLADRFPRNFSHFNFSYAAKPDTDRRLPGSRPSLPSGWSVLLPGGQ